MAPALCFVVEDRGKIARQRHAGCLFNSTLVEKLVEQSGAGFVHHPFAPPGPLADGDIEIGPAMKEINVDHIEADLDLTLPIENPDQIAFVIVGGCAMRPQTLT